MQKTSRENIIGKRISDFMASDADIQTLTHRVSNVIREGKFTDPQIYSMRRTDGSYFKFEAMSKFIYWKGNKGFLTIGREFLVGYNPLEIVNILFSKTN